MRTLASRSYYAAHYGRKNVSDGLSIPANAESGVTWIHSYVSADKHETFCNYDGPGEAAIRKSAEDNGSDRLRRDGPAS